MAVESRETHTVPPSLQPLTISLHSLQCMTAHGEFQSRTCQVLLLRRKYITLLYNQSNNDGAVCCILQQSHDIRHPPRYPRRCLISPTRHTDLHIRFTPNKPCPSHQAAFHHVWRTRQRATRRFAVARLSNLLDLDETYPVGVHFGGAAVCTALAPGRYHLQALASLSFHAQFPECTGPTAADTPPRSGGYRLGGHTHRTAGQLGSVPEPHARNLLQLLLRYPHAVAVMVLCEVPEGGGLIDEMRIVKPRW